MNRLGVVFRNVIAISALAAIALMATPARAQIPHEVEPNNNFTNSDLAFWGDFAFGRVRGDLPPGDVDWYQFASPHPGDRLFVATMTSASATSSNTRLTVYGSDGTTVLETDEDDATFGALASSIAGLTLPAADTYYIKVEPGVATTPVIPYDLYVSLADGAATLEVEPNNTGPTAQRFPPGGRIIGNTSSETDIDFYSFTANAGETIYAGLDLDPERDGTDWNGLLRMEPFNGQALAVNDAGGTGPDSEAMFMTVRGGGTYYVGVQGQPGGGAGTYSLVVNRREPAAWAHEATFTWNGAPVNFGPGPSETANFIDVPEGALTVGKVAVSINLTHTNMPDLDARLVAPSGKTVTLFSDIGAAGQNAMNFVLDDEAAIPAGIYPVNAGMHYQLEGGKRLDWFAGEPAAGTWTLIINDDAANNGGTLNGWTLRIYEAPPPPPDCTPGTTEGAEVTIFSTDFESGAAGFAHLGAQDEWELGNPSFAPVTGCNSGTNCWKTDLDNTYNASSNQELVSPPIDLAGLSAPIVAHWAQKYQMEFANFDRMYAEVREVGVPASARRLWMWGGPPMRDSVGSPPIAVNEHAGWQMRHVDISDFAGAMIELRFHVDSDPSLQLAGLAIDDVSVTACAPVPCPADINGDSTVDVNDLLLLIGAWGSNDPAADINDDNVVDVNDLLLLVGGWGDC